MSHSKGRRRFRPETTVFRDSSKILPGLLNDVIECYQKGRNVCKFCYFRRKLDRQVRSTDEGPYCHHCGKYTEGVWLMPASRFCENFDNMREVPIPRKPKWFIENKDKPFGVCTRSSHYGCFEMSATSEIWFAHTIEELVVWTIEREYGCSFKQYIKDLSNSKWNREDNSTPSSLSSSRIDLDEFDEIENKVKYDPQLTKYIVFHKIKDIPRDLLMDVIQCYKQRADVCKYCFYYRMKEVSQKVNRSEISRCSVCDKQWIPIKVISASRMCNNFANMSRVPINVPYHQNYDELPPHEYCAKSDHYRCFQSYPDTGFWYAHSIEELVVWTVEKETVGYGNFKDYEYQHDTVNATPIKTDDNHRDTPKKYYPKECDFTTINSVPSNLLSSIAQCFEYRLNTCRACFFDSLDGSDYNSHPTLSCKEEGSNMCERGHYWRSIRVIPASDLCESYGSYLAIPPVPKHMYKSKSPFQMCRLDAHEICFVKTRETNPWFPHTVEETVIWTVERETDRDFSSVYSQYLPTMPPFSRRTPSPFQKQAMKFAEEERKRFENSNTQSTSGHDLDLHVAIATLVEGVQGLGISTSSLLGHESETVTSVPRSSENVVVNGNKTPPITFIDDTEPNNELLDHLTSHETKNNMRMPLGDGGLTIDEATMLFPALINSNGSGSIDIRGVSHPGNIDPFMTQTPKTNIVVPRSIPQLPPVAPGLSSLTLRQPPPEPIPTNISNMVPPVQLSPTKMEIDIAELSEDEEEVYECYLCYREFDSAKDIAKHCMKQNHVDIIKKDTGGERVWEFYPPPPDQTPEEFGLCNRSSRCAGRLRCCKAHSKEEIKEWSLRYQHRINKSSPPSTPSELVTMATSGEEITLTDNCTLISMKIKPSVVIETNSSKRTPTWSITISGQGWQTLFGIECHLKSFNDKSVFIINAIKGDTIYTICPKTEQWIAPSFEEGILLGCVTVTIKASSLSVGSHDCHVKFHIGFQRFLYINLQAVYKE